MVARPPHVDLLVPHMLNRNGAAALGTAWVCETTSWPSTYQSKWVGAQNILKSGLFPWWKPVISVSWKFDTPFQLVQSTASGLFPTCSMSISVRESDAYRKPEDSERGNTLST